MAPSQIARERLRFGVLALLAVLVAAPGVHLAERWLPQRTAFWVSHGLALFLLAIVAWRWVASRTRTSSSRRVG